MSANMQDGGDPTAACRTCTDFRTWAKLTKQAFDASKKDGKQDSNSKQGDSNNGGLMTVSTTERLHKQCPLDRDELGRNTWSLLHTIAAYYPRMPTASQKQDMKNFFNILGRIYPCDHCAADLRDDLVESPPVLENPNGFAQWLCRLHNKVNVKLEKPVFDCSRVNERWRDGWRDGSCDS